MIKVEIIADSLNEHGQRLTTFVLTFPRIVLAEFNTHRMISKNSASSRAIPFKKMLEMVKTNPFIPIKWMKDHSGMQGNEFFSDIEIDDNGLDINWLVARDNAVKQAEELSKLGVTKQIVNRLLEPFMYHTVICTASDWENFFALRAHPAAEIHIQDLAHKMLDVYNESTPKQLKAGEWHIPFGDQFDEKRIIKVIAKQKQLDEIFVTKHSKAYEPTLVKVATARCARVSYLNFEGKDDYEADIKLHDMLLTSGHMSPFEHCAVAMSENEYRTNLNGNINSVGCEREDYDGGNYSEDVVIPNNSQGWSGNFRGFIQYRKMISGKNKSDNRVLKLQNTK
jgi:thymidylate synthase ThyX